MSDRVVTAFAPATVSNVACGFDVLGFPMEEPGDTVSVRFIASGVEIDDITGDGGRIPRQPEKNTASVAARAMLRTDVPLADAVKQWANLGALVDALHRSDFDLLSRSLQDSIAEPRRAPLIPGLANIKKAAMDAGALGSSISGSGPSIFALCRDRATADRVAVAMTAAVAKEIGGESQVYVSAISSRGAHVIG